MSNYLQYLPRDLDTVINNLIDPIYKVKLDAKKNSTALFIDTQHSTTILPLSEDTYSSHRCMDEYIRIGRFATSLDNPLEFTLKHINHTILIQSDQMTQLYQDPQNDLHDSIIRVFQDHLVHCSERKCKHAIYL